MLEQLDALRELTIWSVLLRFLIAALFGSVIGIERGRRHHAAGLRTHAVVCIGAAAVMMVNQYLIQVTPGGGDPARMGAQVISGIGFLGAGTIIITGRHQGQRVRGLTTAAGLWASACMGLAIGSGFFEGAVIMCLLLVLVIAAMTYLDEAYVKSAPSEQLYLELQNTTPFSNVLDTLRKQGWHMTSLQYLKGGGEDRTAVLLDVQQQGHPQPVRDFVESVRSMEGVIYAQEL